MTRTPNSEPLGTPGTPGIPGIPGIPGTSGTPGDLGVPGIPGKAGDSVPAGMASAAGAGVPPEVSDGRFVVDDVDADGASLHGAGAALRRTWQDAVDASRRSDVPEGLWMRCPNCEAMLYRKNVEQNLHVCPDCDSHFRIGADERAAQLCDPGSFEPMWSDLAPVDVLEFADLKPYKKRLSGEQPRPATRMRSSPARVSSRVAA
jgi:hypothetical protein